MKKNHTQEILRNNLIYILKNTSISMNKMDIDGIVSKGYMSKYLKNEDMFLSDEIIQKIADYLKYPFEDLTNKNLTGNKETFHSKKPNPKTLSEPKEEYKSKSNLGLKPLVEMNILEMQEYHNRILEDLNTLESILKHFDKTKKPLEPLINLKNEKMVKVPYIGDSYIKDSQKLIDSINNMGTLKEKV